MVIVHHYSPLAFGTEMEFLEAGEFTASPRLLFFLPGVHRPPSPGKERGNETIKAARNVIGVRTSNPALPPLKTGNLSTTVFGNYA